MEGILDNRKYLFRRILLFSLVGISLVAGIIIFIGTSKYNPKEPNLPMVLIYKFETVSREEYIEDFDILLGYLMKPIHSPKLRKINMGLIGMN